MENVRRRPQLIVIQIIKPMSPLKAVMAISDITLFTNSPRRITRLVVPVQLVTQALVLVARRAMIVSTHAIATECVASVEIVHPQLLQKENVILVLPLLRALHHTFRLRWCWFLFIGQRLSG
jgi:hypothetical protein